MTTRCNESAPRLIVDLTDLVLIHAIRLHVGASHDYRRKLHDARLIHTHLAAADPDGHCADLIRAAIMAAWWLDLNWASERGLIPLLDHMLDLHRAGKRPLQYSRHGLDRAAEKGFFDVVQWLYARKSERIMWFPDMSPEAFAKGLVLASPHQLQATLKWYLSRFAYLGNGSDPARAVVAMFSHAIEAGNETLLGLLVPYLKMFPCVILRADHKQMQLAGTHKSEAVILWIARHTFVVSMSWCRYYALIGAFASGDLAWVEACCAKWLEQLNMPESHARVSVHMVCSINRLWQKCLRAAGQAGHVHLIEWVLDKFPCKQGEQYWIQLDELALSGRLHVLKWWKGVGVQLVGQKRIRFISRTPNILFQLARRGLTAIVEWWVDSSELPFESGETPIVAAAKFGNVELLSWWDSHTHSLPPAPGKGSNRFHFTVAALEQASIRGHVHVLEWWKQHGKPFPAPHSHEEFTIIKRLCQHGQLDTLKWWWAHTQRESDFELPAAMWASEHHMLQLLQVAQGAQLDVFEWLSGVRSKHFRKPVAFRTSDKFPIHPLLAKFYIHSNGSELPVLELNANAKSNTFRQCIRKGLVLVLLDLLKQSNTKVAHDMYLFSLHINIRPTFAREMCVYEYLVQTHGVKYKAGTATVVRLVKHPALFALEWLDCRSVKLPKDMDKARRLVARYKYLREDGVHRETSMWLQGKLNKEPSG